jgi:hypothetical protein
VAIELKNTKALLNPRAVDLGLIEKRVTIKYHKRNEWRELVQHLFDIMDDATTTRATLKIGQWAF